MGGGTADTVTNRDTSVSLPLAWQRKWVHNHRSRGERPKHPFYKSSPLTWEF